MDGVDGAAWGPWFELGDEYPGISVQVDVRDGRATIVGVQVLRSEGVTVTDLRSVPIPQLEALWNDPGRRFVASIANATTLVSRLPPEEIQSLRKYPESVRRMVRRSAAQAFAGLPTKSKLRLEVPESHRYPDEFYKRVAALYRALVAAGRRPAPAIAEANDVPVTTVHAWVKEARRRGFLAQARKAGSTG